MIRVRDDKCSSRGIKIRVRNGSVDISTLRDGRRLVDGDRIGPGTFRRKCSFDLREGVS
ncbi:hypothetical protein ES702_00211 [subsurface metagenome]